MQHHARGADVLERLLLPALVFHQLEDSTDVLFVGENRSQNYRLFDLTDFAGVGPARGIIDFDQRAIGLSYFVANAGRGSDEFEGELALQALLNNFHVQQAEKAATEAEAQRHRTFRLEEET